LNSFESLVTEKEQRRLELRSKAAISAGCAFAYGRFCLAVSCAGASKTRVPPAGNASFAGPRHIDFFTKKKPGPRFRTRLRTWLQSAPYPHICWAQTSDAKTALKSLSTKILLGGSYTCFDEQPDSSSIKSSCEVQHLPTPAEKDCVHP
jgi:hypothetical protein